MDGMLNAETSDNVEQGFRAPRLWDIGHSLLVVKLTAIDRINWPVEKRGL